MAGYQNVYQLKNLCFPVGLPEHIFLKATGFRKGEADHK